MSVDGDAALGQAVLEDFENFVVAAVEPLEVLDAGELVLEFGRDVSRLEVDGQDDGCVSAFPFGGNFEDGQHARRLYG